MKYKKLILSVIACMLFFLCSCQLETVKLSANESYYSNFEVKDDKVYIYCNLQIENSTKEEKIITLVGTFDHDAENGLLKNAKLYGYLHDCKTKNIHLVPGKNRLEVVFVGSFAGKAQKYDRLLPEIQIQIIQ